VDFGKTTDVLLGAAIKFAKEVNGRLCLIHVAPMDLGLAVGDIGMQYFPEIEQSEIREELLELNRLEQQVVAQGVDCEHLLKQGIPKDIILAYAEQKDAGYIVMGSHGRSGIYDVFIGSLTKELTKLSPIPVLVVPCHEK
jgi:universal stress family protein